MNRFIIIGILFFPLNLFSQTGPCEPIFCRDTVPDAITFDSSIKKDIDKSAFEIFITLYSDSINDANSSKTLPLFLTDPDFDYHNSNFWFPPDSKISLRNIIILRTTNCAALKLIITDGSGMYRKKPKKDHKINYYNSSFYDLAAKRYLSLECDR